MVKPRLCFTLLYANGKFHLSRNFQLQAVGDVDWLIENYEFDSIARSIDELIILNVSRDSVDWNQFVECVQKIVRHCFMPVAVGGGVRSIEQAELLFSSGADKVVLNTAFLTDKDFISQLVSKYGSQSIIASLDFKRIEGGACHVIIDNGQTDTGLDLEQAFARIVAVGAGELYLNSIERDGTGMGYDLEAIELAFNACGLPLIVAGGADTYDRLAEGIESGFVSAVTTAHLFNFMGDGLKDARMELMKSGIALSEWNFEELQNAYPR